MAPHAVIWSVDELDLGQPERRIPVAVIYEGDAEQMLDYVADSSCKLAVTSPPYNIGKEYERDIRRTLPEYLDWAKPIITRLCNKVTSDGSVCWQTGNFVENGELFPLDIYFYEIFRQCGFKLRNRIIWHFNFGLHAQRRLSGRYETLLWWTKSDEYTFNLDDVRVPQLYPGKRHGASKGTLAGKPSGNPKGKNPSDFWSFSPHDAFVVNPIWELPNVKSNHPEKTFHPCQFPAELVTRCVLALTDPGDTVLDPFVGSGTSALAACVAGRNAIGIDRDPRYVALARHRLSLLEQDRLVLREHGRAVRSPQSREQVARVPTEWLPLEVECAGEPQRRFV